MDSLIFATNNKHKIDEVTNILYNQYKIISLSQIGIHEDIPETAPTIEGNASQKSWYIYNKIHQNCFADDTGLEVMALNGEPGVYSARYAGNTHDFDLNIIKLLDKLKNIKDRRARFRTVVSLILNGEEFQFEGILSGHIITEKKGSHGFGYDPVFVPENYSKTLAEIEPVEKNRISHRAIAMNKVADFLNIK
ncbi:MAG TPA: non-canonical purine NTP diphosphatase [Lentimicrobium sp.]|nr:non-canonical purine NTP diphosphatase [Lentimicrobium sp.]